MGIHKAVAMSLPIGLAIGTASIGAMGAGKAHNWMREYVQLRERAMLERAVGAERAAQLGGITPQIVGGTKARKNANRFQVALLFADEPDNFFAQYCGGSLYKSNIVVTAAHCSDFVTAGEVQVLTNTRSLDGSGIRRGVASITVHPDWNPVTFDSDVAVWVLTSHVHGVQADLASLAGEPTSGTSLATGWGNTEVSGFPIDLRQVFVPLVSRERCNAQESYDGAVTDTMICAGLEEGGKDTCQGDSGGPLTTPVPGGGSDVGSYRVLTGITSWGEGCADPNFFGVYTRVAKFRDWINAQIAPH
jgi:secreted trypsin-like serine protease